MSDFKDIQPSYKRRDRLIGISKQRVTRNNGSEEGQVVSCKPLGTLM